MSGQTAVAEPAEMPNLEERLTLDTASERKRAQQALEAVLSQGIAKQVLQMYDHLAAMRDAEVLRAEPAGEEYHLHGLAVVMRYNPEGKHARHFCEGARSRSHDPDVFKGDIIHPDNHLRDGGFRERLFKAMEIDGAVLVDSEGYALHSGYVISLDTQWVFRKHPRAQASYEKMAKHAEPGTRHRHVLALTALLKDVVVLTLKSDKPQVRIIYQGQILHSTCEREANYRKPDVSILERAYDGMAAAAASVGSGVAYAVSAAFSAARRVVGTSAGKAP